MSLRYFTLISLILIAGCGLGTKHKTTDEELKRIADDTTMQSLMERSYEFQRTVAESDSVVFDFMAYDIPIKGNNKQWEKRYHLIRRTGNHEDTVQRGSRIGHVENLWRTDMDNNNRSEILWYETAAPDTMVIHCCEMDRVGDSCIAKPVKVVKPAHHSAGSDILYFQSGQLVWQYAVQDTNHILSMVRQYYTFAKGSFLPDRKNVNVLPKVK